MHDVQTLLKKVWWPTPLHCFLVNCDTSVIFSLLHCLLIPMFYALIVLSLREKEIHFIGLLSQSCSGEDEDDDDDDGGEDEGPGPTFEVSCHQGPTLLCSLLHSLAMPCYRFFVGKYLYGNWTQIPLRWEPVSGKRWTTSMSIQHFIPVSLTQVSNIINVIFFPYTSVTHSPVSIWQEPTTQKSNIVPE